MTTPQPKPWKQAIEDLSRTVDLDSHPNVDTHLVENSDNAAKLSAVANVFGTTPDVVNNALLDEIDRQESEPSPHADYDAMLVARQQDEFTKSGD
jgi:hypothetical protein